MFDLGNFASPDASAGNVAVDDSPMVVPAEVAAAAAHSRHRLKAFFSFENIIFLLAACLILGGTLYLVATTWKRVPSHWQQIYAEGLLVFYGWVLLATAHFLRRRLQLDAPASVLAALAAAMAVGAGLLGASAFGQGTSAGLLATALAQILALPAAATLLAIQGGSRRAGLLYGLAVLGLSLAGACTNHGAPMAAAWTAGLGVLASCGLFLRTVPLPRPSFFLAALAPAAGALLLPATLDAPAILVAPSLIMLAFACRPFSRITPPILATVALFALMAAAFWFSLESPSLLVAIAALALLATFDLRSQLPQGLGFAIGAALVFFLAFTWTSVFGLQPWPENLLAWEWSSESIAQLSVAAAGALPWVLAVFVLALERKLISVEIFGYLMLLVAASLNAAPYPEIGIFAGAVAVATTLLAYGYARAAKGDIRLLIAHLLGLGAAFLLGQTGGTVVALAAVGAYGLALMILRPAAGFWLGVVAVPLCAVAALANSETRWLPCALLALYGLVLVVPRPSHPKGATALPLPALVFALLIALFYAGSNQTSLLETRHLTLVLCLSLLPTTLWIAIGRAPLIIAIEVCLGMAVAAAGGSAIAVLLALLAVLAGRDQRAMRFSAIAYLVLAMVAIYQQAPKPLLIAALAIAGALCLVRRLTEKDRFVRWLAMPGLLAAWMAIGFYSASGTPWLPLELVPAAFGVGLTPFFAWAALRKKPDFLAVESVVGLVLILSGGLLFALFHESGLPSAVAAGLAALALLVPLYEKDQKDGLASPSARFVRWLAMPGFLAALLLGGFTSYAGTALWPAQMAVPALVLGLSPFFVYALIRPRPLFILVESVVGLVVSLAAGLFFTVLHESGTPSAIASGLAALALLLPYCRNIDPAGPDLHELRSLRWLAMPGFLAALLLGGFTGHAGTWPASMAVPALVLGLSPFFVYALLRPKTLFLLVESVVGLVVSLAAGLFFTELHESGTPSAIASGLAALALVLPFCRKLDPAGPDLHELRSMRWLAMPGFLAALLLGGFSVHAGAWPASMAVPALVLGLSPFFVYALIRPRTLFILAESVVGLVVSLVAGLLFTLVHESGTPSAIAAALAALALLLPKIDPAGPGGLRFVRWLAIPGFLAALLLGGFTSHGGTPWWPAQMAVPALLLGLLPFFAYALLRRRPDFVVVESVAGLVLATTAGLANALLSEPGIPPGIAAALAALALLIPMSAKTDPVRWLGMPGALAAFAILYLHGFTDTAWTPRAFFPVGLTIAVAPFFLAVLLRGGPAFLAKELLVGTGLMATFNLAYGFTGIAGSPENQATGIAALAGLWMFLAMAKKTDPRLVRVAWIGVPLLCPVAVAPMTDTMLCWPAAVTAVAMIALLCIQSRRHKDGIMAACALAVGLAVVVWAGAATFKPFSHGGDPSRHLAVLAILIAVYGMIMASKGRRISAATPGFLRILQTITVLLAEMVLLLGIGLRAEPGVGEALSVILAFATLCCAAILLAFRLGQGWPFYIADTALGMAYGFVRLRTGWLDGMADFDSLAACLFALVNVGIARTLRKWREGLGAKESQIMAMVLPLLAPLFLQIQSPWRATGTFAAAATYAWFARKQKRPILGWLAGVLANVGLIPIWLHYDVHSPALYALPIGATLGLLGRFYDKQLGKTGSVVRSLASLFVFATTSYQMFQFSSPWPALILAVCAITAVLLGIKWRVRAYLYTGFACLVLDIVANLTRWGLEDRIKGALFGLGAGMALLALGIWVARHKAKLLARYHSMQEWNW